MTAGLFAEHGVWTGSCREPSKWNPKGFFENIPLKHILKRRWPLFIADGKMPRPQDGFRDEITEAVLNDGYTYGKWLMKHSALYWPVWHEWSPKWVCVRRDKDAIFRSCRESKMLAPRHDDEHLRRVIEMHDQEMDKAGGPNVYTDQVVKGDLGSLKEAMSHCGIEMDEDKVKAFVNPKHWHHRAA